MIASRHGGVFLRRSVVGDPRLFIERLPIFDPAPPGWGVIPDTLTSRSIQTTSAVTYFLSLVSACGCLCATPFNPFDPSTP